MKTGVQTTADDNSVTSSDKWNLSLLQGQATKKQT